MSKQLNFERIFKVVSEELGKLSRRIRRLERATDKSGSLRIKELDGSPDYKGILTIEVPNGSLTQPSAKIARLDFSVSGGIGNSGVAFFWPTNSYYVLFQAYEAMTLQIEYSNYNGGSITWTIDGVSASSPFELDAGSILRGTLTGSSSVGTAALKRTA